MPTPNATREFVAGIQSPYSDRIEKLEHKVRSLIDAVVLQQKALHEMLSIQARLQSQIDGTPVHLEPLPPVVSRADHEVEALERLLDLDPEGEEPHE